MNELTAINGKLPATYVAAKKALAQCSRVDECADWANKAAALASYARQAKDETLRRMADRIQARATRRCGELLKQVPPSPGRVGKSAEATRLTRAAVARDAGISTAQMVSSLRVANIPEARFEQLVESDNPPRITTLAEIGMGERRVQEVDVSAIRKFARFCGSTDAASYAASVSDPDLKKELNALVGEIDSWLDQFITSL